jgi:hypothetical protein
VLKILIGCQQFKNETRLEAKRNSQCALNRHLNNRKAPVRKKCINNAYVEFQYASNNLKFSFDFIKTIEILLMKRQFL